MTQGYKPRNTTWDTDDVISNAWAVWVKNILAGGSAASGTEVYFSPIDLTVAWTSATELTINWVTLPVEPVTEQFIKIIEFKANGVAFPYSPDQYQFAYDQATNILTVTGAAFVNTSTYRIEVLAQAKSVEVEATTAHDLRTTVAGVDPTTGRVRTPWVDALNRVHVVIEAGNTPVMDTLVCTAAENVGNAVYNLAGVARQANAGAAITMPSIGVIQSKPTATSAIVVFAGRCTSVAGAPGDVLFVDKVNGLLTTTLPTAIGGFARKQQMGWIDTTGQMIVQLGENYPAP